MLRRRHKKVDPDKLYWFFFLNRVKNFEPIVSQIPDFFWLNSIHDKRCLLPYLILTLCILTFKRKEKLYLKMLSAMRGSRNFRQGGGVQINLTKKMSEVKWLISKKTIIFKVQEGVQYFSGGGSNFFQGGGGGPIAYSL